MIRRSIKEIKMRYSLANFSDVYVEGESDRRFFQMVAKHIESKDVKFYSIDSVEIDHSLASKYGLKASLNRDKVMVLVLELSPTTDYPLGLVDRDFCDWRSDDVEHDNLIYTDFANADMYCISKEYVSSLFELLKINLSVESIFQVLNTMFVLRFVASSNKIGLKILDTWCKHIEISSNTVSLDVKKLVRLSNNRQKCLTTTDQIITKYDEVVDQYPDIVERGYFNGHDAFALLSKLVAKYRKKCHMNDDDIRDWMQFAAIPKNTMTSDFIKRIYG